MIPTQIKERIAELISRSVNANENELTDLFWKVVVGNMPDDVKMEFSELMSEIEKAGLDLDFQPGVGISLFPKIMRGSASGKVN